MSDYVIPVLFALFLWWFSTGAILYLDGLGRRSNRTSMAVATVVLALALYGLAATSGNTTTSGAYVAFVCGLAVWGWHELSFLTGYVTGPRRTACPADSHGFQRLAHAVQVVLYHEIAIALTAGLIVLLTWNEANQVGTWTFVILWLMRLSSKINIFMGVPNLTESFLPEHLGYLKSYFRYRPMNLFFPLSVTVSLLVACAVAQGAAAAPAGGFEATGTTLLLTLLSLAILEHIFMVLPLPVERLWAWGLRSHGTQKQKAYARDPLRKL